MLVPERRIDEDRDLCTTVEAPCSSPELIEPEPVRRTMRIQHHSRLAQTEGRARDELGRDSTDLLLQAAARRLSEAAERCLREPHALLQLGASACAAAGTTPRRDADAR